MQDVQMLRAEINQNLNFLPLESLKLVADYIDSLCVNPRQATVIQNSHKSSTMDWDSWFAKCDKLTERVLKRRNGEYIDTKAIWESVEADLEENDNRIIGNILDGNRQARPVNNQNHK